MPNSVWFFILALFGSFLVAYSLWRTERPRRRLLLIFFTIAGMAYVFEYIILILFHSYDYSLELIGDQWLDSVIGAVSSQALIIPATTMWIVAFDLGFFGMIGFAFLLMGIEELFLWLDIYEQNWWETWYTGFFLFICFWIGKAWWKLLTKGKKWAVWFTLIFTMVFLNHTLVVLWMILWDPYHYTLGWFANRTRNTLAFDALICYADSVLATFIILRWFKWYSLLFLYVLHVILYKILEWQELLYFTGGWNSFVFAIGPVLSTIITFLINRSLLKSKSFN